MKRIFFFLLFFTLLTPDIASAQIYINEISPSTDPEWVELYAVADSNLQNCVLYLHENVDTKQKILFSDSIALAANTYFVVKKGEYSWTSNWLNNGGDTVKLNCPNFSDSHTFSDSDDKTIGRSPDGHGSFFVLTNESMGVANSPPTPQPTPKPTEPPKTPIPTFSPSPVPTVIAAATEIVKRTPVSKTNTPKPTTKALINNLTVSPTAATTPVSENKNTASPFSFVLIGLGLIISGAGAYPFAKKIYYNDKHADDPQIP